MSSTQPKKLIAADKQMEQMERMPAEERQRYLEGRLRELIRYAYKKAPGIKARFDKAGIDPLAISTIQDLEKLPILRKEELVGLHEASPPFGGLVTVPPKNLERIYVSPGPIFDPHHQSETFWRRNVQVFRNIGFGKGDVIINTWSYHLVPAGLVTDETLRRAGATVIPSGVGNTELQVQVMRQLKVTGFCGSTGFLMNIIKKAEEMGYDIRRDFHLRLAWAGGEMGGGPIRAMIEKNYGIQTRDIYAVADLGFVAYECAERNGMHIAEDMIIELVDPKSGKQVSPGQVGEVVVTPINHTYPLVRFGTGDISTITYEICPCGRSSPRLTRILGRVGDAVRVRAMFIHPRQLESVLLPFTEISKFQAGVTRPGYRDELVLKVELKTEEGIDKEKLKDKLIKAVQEAIRISPDGVEFVPEGTIPEEHKLIVDDRIY